MQKLKNLIFLVSVMLLILGSSFSSFAITSAGVMSWDVFEDGPWQGYSYGIVRVKSDGSLVQYGTPTWDEASYYYPVGAMGYIYDAYVYSGQDVSNVIIRTSNPLQELYVIDSAGNTVSNVLNDALICVDGSRYYYGVSLFGSTGVSFRSDGQFSVSEFSTSYRYYDVVSDNMPVMSGFYDGNSVAIKYPGFWVDSVVPYSSKFGFYYYYFPVACIDVGDSYDLLGFAFYGEDAVIHEGSNYHVNFKVSNVSSGALYFYSLDSVSDDVLPVNGLLSFSFAGYDTTLSDIYFRVVRSFDLPDALCITYVSSSSDDVGVLPPDDDSGGGSSGLPDYSAAIGQIGSTLKELLNSQDSSTTTIVNNITNATTTISNTISNVSTQITNTLQNVQQGLENKLQGVQEGISGTIEQSNQELMQNDEKLHSEKLEADKENTQAVTDAVEEHGNFIIEGLKGLFIPSDDFFKSYFDDLYDFFSEAFGFLSFPIDLLVRLIDLFANSSDRDCILTLPSFEISGEQLITEASFNLTEFLENDFSLVLSSIRMVTSIGLIMAFVSLCQTKWNEVMRN